MSNMFSIAWDARRVTKKGTTAVSQRQQQRLTELVQFARQHSPFYKAHYQTVPTDFSDISQLPPTTKPELMASFDQWVTDREVTLETARAFVADINNLGQDYLGKYYIWTTSGTSGDPAILLHDQHWFNVTSGLSMARVLPTWLNGKVMRGLMQNGARSAAIFANNGHFMGVSMAERQRQSNKRRQKQMRVFSVQTPIPELVAQLNEFQPAILSGYATVQDLLAQEQLNGRLHIQPALVSSSGESLSTLMKERIQAAWGVKVWDAYSTSETGVIAAECKHGRLHLNADWFILEAVDADNQLVPAGQPSHKVLLTNLASHIQPIIRYEMSDSVTFYADACACGSPLPSLRIEGRTDESLAIPNAQGEMVYLLPLALGSAVEKTPGVHRFQIVQTTPTTLCVRLDAVDGVEKQEVWTAVSAQLRTLLDKQNLNNVTIELAYELPQRNERGGKLNHVISLVAEA